MSTDYIEATPEYKNKSYNDVLSNHESDQYNLKTSGFEMSMDNAIEMFNYTPIHRCHSIISYLSSPKSGKKISLYDAGMKSIEKKRNIEKELKKYYRRSTTPQISNKTKSLAMRQGTSEERILTAKVYSSGRKIRDESVDECTFTPTITNYSFTNERYESNDLIERLYSPDPRVIKRQKDIEEEHMKECTFHPVINKNNKKNNEERSFEEFYNDQMKYKEKTKEKLELTTISETKKNDSKIYTHKPDMNDSKRTIDLIYQNPPVFIEGEKIAYRNFYRRLEKAREHTVNNPQMWLDGSGWTPEVTTTKPFHLTTSSRGCKLVSPIKSEKKIVKGNKSNKKPFRT